MLSPQTNKIILRVGSILLGLTIFSVLLLFVSKHTFVRIQVSDASIRYALTRADTGQQVANEMTSHSFQLPVGDYILSSTGTTGDKAGMRLIRATSGIHTITVAVDSPAKSIKHVISESNFTEAEQFAGGYLAITKSTRNIVFVNSHGISTSLSSSLSLANAPPDPSNPTQDVAYDITVMKTGNAIVSTTSGIFLISNSLKVQLVTSFPDVYFTASAYDESTNQLYMLAADSKNVYSLDLNNPYQTPTVLFTVGKNINRITANGSKIAVYFDNVPSIDPVVVQSYTKNYQIEPVLYDLDSKKESSLPDAGIITFLSFSPDGTKMASKFKFSHQIKLTTFATQHSIFIPAPDTGSAVWEGNIFYFARNGSIWSYDSQPIHQQNLTYVAASGPIVDMRSINNVISAITTNGSVVNVTDKNQLTSSYNSITTLPLQLLTSSLLYEYFAQPKTTLLNGGN